MDKDRLEELLEELNKATMYLDPLLRIKEITIPELKSTYKYLEKKEKEFNEQLEKIRNKCSHKWEYDGHGHNDDCYKCIFCGEIEWR